jgi:molybdate transport system substrate-binding protein
VAAKSKVILGRKFVGEALAAGEVELGPQQLSELRLEAGVGVVGPLPEELQKAGVVTAAVSSRARRVEAATRFVAFLSGPFAAGAIRDSGLELPAP